MGREWYNGGRSICSSKSKRKSNEANGCITALSHFFHFHHFYFPSRHRHTQHSIDSHSRYPKGLVAPRNSLELTEESPLSTNYKEKKSLNISVGRTKSKLRTLLIDTSSDFCNSPRTKTPNVVARLMGLDLLPDNLDLNRSARNSVRGHRLSGNGSGSRSLPESPRISSARKSDSEFGRWRQKELKEDEESPSLRHNERQIKERIIRRRVDSKEKLKRANEQTLIPINGWKKADTESKSSPNRNKQRKDSISISTHSKSDRCDLLEKKKCKKISVASSAFSTTERPRKQTKRAQEPKPNADATICSGQVYINEEKLPQQPPRKELEEQVEVERVVAEIESQIVDALVIETVKTTSFAWSNALHSKTASAFYLNH